MSSNWSQYCCAPGCNNNTKTDGVSLHIAPAGKHNPKHGLSFNSNAWGKSLS